MTKQEKISRLVKIADYLDRNELPEDADLIDNLTKHEILDNEEVEIPEDEYKMLRQIYEALGRSFKSE